MSESPVQDAIREQIAGGGDFTVRQLAGDDPTRDKAIRKALVKMEDRGEVESRKEGISLSYRLAQLAKSEREIFTVVPPRFGGWTEDQGPIPDVWHDHLRKPGHRCLWSVRWHSNATPKYPLLTDMSLEQLLFELRDIVDRHNQLSRGNAVMLQGQRKFWTNPEATILYEAIQADGGPRLSELRMCIAGCRQRSPDYVMYAEPGQPALWPFSDQGKLRLGSVRFRPGWPAPRGADREAWALEAKVAAQTEISPEKAKQIAIARRKVMGFLNGVSD